MFPGELSQLYKVCIARAAVNENVYMWQSWIEIECYSIVYFECITEFDTL